MIAPGRSKPGKGLQKDLHDAIRLCSYNDLRRAIQNGADVNSGDYLDKSDFYPLLQACADSKGLWIVRLLIEHGADPNARDDNGAAPMDMILTNELANEYFAKAVKKAIARTHAAGRPSFHGDGFGLFYLYPDGHKEYISEAEADEILKGRDRYNTDPEILKALGRDKEQ
mgnify:CR=1 FL=1